MVLPLYNIALGETAAVSVLTNENDMAGRLADLGFLPGEKVSCVLLGPKKHMAAYLVRNAVIALRAEDSRQIFVEVQS